MTDCTSGSFSPIAIRVYSPSVNLHTYSYPIMRQIHDWVQLCSLRSTKDWVPPLGRQSDCRHHPKWEERSVGGAWGSFKIPPPSGCHLCLRPTPPRPFLMKLDCLFCSAGPLILSTGALYNSLMLIVTNKSNPRPSTQTPLTPASSSVRQLTPRPDGCLKRLGSLPGSTGAAM